MFWYQFPLHYQHDLVFEKKNKFKRKKDFFTSSSLYDFVD